MKRLITCLLTISLLLSCSPAANAHDVPQERNDCGIEVIVRYDGEDVNGGTLTAIRVGYVDEEDGNYFFCQEITGNTLEDLESPDMPAVQKEFYDQNKDDFEFYTQTQTVREGKATFCDLPTGVYLIVQDQAAYGFSKLSPFLVSVPYYTDGEYQYQVTAAIKSELERVPEPTVDSSSTPDDPKLPQTGQLNWPIPVMVAVGLGFFAVGWVLCFRKKKEY